MQQGVQTDATCNIQERWELLANNVASVYLDICLLGNFPVSQVLGSRCTLLAGNSSISLAGSEEEINFSQQSPKIS